MSDEQTIDWRNWIRKIPGVASLRLDDDEIISLKAKKWANAASIIEANGPAKIEALDADGAILRVWTDKSDRKRTSSENISASTLTALAQVIGDISDKAAARHENAYRAAFDSQQRLVQTISDRLYAMEKSWQQMLVVRKREIEESIIVQTSGAAGSEDGMLEQLAMGVLGNAMGGGSPAASANGKAGK